VSDKPSAAWYLAPIFMGVIGSAIMWYVLKDEDHPDSPKMVRKGWVIGIVLTVVSVGWIPFMLIPMILIGDGEGHMGMNIPEPEVRMVPTQDTVSHGGLAVDYVSLIDNLRVNASVNPEGEIEQPFFSVTGFSIQVNDANVQVFEYSTAEDAEADASLVSIDGSSIGTSMPFWVDVPHFYYKEKIIVLYVGDDPAIEELLESVLGPQFAGR